MTGRTLILDRSMGLTGATGVGVGAIVGGGILALSGIAFATTGPGAILAFALNGMIAALTVLSFAEMAAAFPESGGTYTFAKKVLSAPAAFMVGWVVWFASVVASVLYALGFAFYATNAANRLIGYLPWRLPVSLTHPYAIILTAICAILGYSLSLIYTSSEGGQWATWGKVALFGVIIAAGFWFLSKTAFSSVHASLTPFFTNGPKGLFQAMGYTFIALQGFDLIAAVAGEVKHPEKNVPRAMLLSLGIALAVYLPLLFVMTTAGVAPGQDIASLSQAHTETVMALAVQNFMGPFGYWLIMTAAVFAMLSALRANLFAASRIALAMARDRSLPRQIERISKSKKTPIHATLLTMLTVMVILLIIPDVAKIGAAAGLIFLVSFALAHWTAILARVRTGSTAMPFLAPWFPATHIAGALACIGLAVFQGIQVPAAGLISVVWLGIGGVLYLMFFAQRAAVVDASSAALDPRLQTLRGRNPLVLAPIVNPTNAEFMIFLASAMAPPEIGRVMLLSVVKPPQDWRPGNDMPQITNIRRVLDKALAASFTGGLAPQVLITISPDPWQEIVQTARVHHCESLLLGLSDLGDEKAVGYLETVMSRVDSDIVVLRAANGWDMTSVKSVLVPVGELGVQDQLRARILGGLQYLGIDNICFLQVLAQDASETVVAQRREWLTQMAEDEHIQAPKIIVARSPHAIEDIIRHAAHYDLLILGLQRLGKRRKLIGNVVRQIAANTSCGLILINRRG